MKRRLLQVQDLIQQELGKILIREIEFPVGIFPNILAVKVSPDLKYARISLGVIPSNRRGTALKRIEKRIGHIQNCLNKKLVMRFVPRLRFVIDGTIDKVERVSEIVNKIHAEDDKNENQN